MRRRTFSIPDRELYWLEELAVRSKISQAEVIRLLIGDAARRVGLPKPEPVKPPNGKEVPQEEK